MVPENMGHCECHGDCDVDGSRYFLFYKLRARCGRDGWRQKTPSLQVNIYFCIKENVSKTPDYKLCKSNKNEFLLVFF